MAVHETNLSVTWLYLVKKRAFILYLTQMLENYCAILIKHNLEYLGLVPLESSRAHSLLVSAYYDEYHYF